MAYGYVGDVNNSVDIRSVYPGGRTFGSVPPAANRYRMRTNSMGELGAINQGRGYQMAAAPAAAAPSAMTPEAMATMSAGPAGKPVTWWITFFVIFVLFIWVARRFAPGGSNSANYGNILPSFYNGVFLTIYIVLILNVLKVAAAKVHVPGLSDMILAI